MLPGGESLKSGQRAQGGTEQKFIMSQERPGNAKRPRAYSERGEKHRDINRVGKLGKQGSSGN